MGEMAEEEVFLSPPAGAELSIFDTLFPRADAGGYSAKGGVSPPGRAEQELLSPCWAGRRRSHISFSTRTRCPQVIPDSSRSGVGTSMVSGWMSRPATLA